ncbi:hypothetical protein [Azospirillum argentinense]
MRPARPRWLRRLVDTVARTVVGEKNHCRTRIEDGGRLCIASVAGVDPKCHINQP